MSSAVNQRFDCAYETLDTVNSLSIISQDIVLDKITENRNPQLQQQILNCGTLGYLPNSENVDQVMWSIEKTDFALALIS